MESRAAQIFERFKKFHRNNPTIWTLFQRFTLDRIKAGYAHHSAFAVINRIRWECNIEVVRDSAVKLSNGYTPYYARLFAVAYPQHADFFRYRKLTTVDKAAYATDIDVFDMGPPNPAEEAQLKLQLIELLGTNGAGAAGA